MNERSFSFVDADDVILFMVILMIVIVILLVVILLMVMMMMMVMMIVVEHEYYQEWNRQNEGDVGEHVEESAKGGWGEKEVQEDDSEH